MKLCFALSFVLFFSFSAGAAGKPTDVDVVNDIKLPKNVRISSIAGSYANKAGDTATVKTAKKSDGQYSVRIEYSSKTLSENVSGDFESDEYRFVSAKADGTITFSEETDCDDVECVFGLRQFIFVRGVNGKYSLSATIDYNADMSSDYGWDGEGQEPTQKSAEKFCKDRLGANATGEFNDEVYCELKVESVLNQQ